MNETSHYDPLGEWFTTWQQLFDYPFRLLMLIFLIIVISTATWLVIVKNK